MTWIALVHAAATWALVGLIWFVQVVHYPGFAGIARSDFGAYHARHVQRTTRVVAPLMLLEAITALLLVLMLPRGLPAISGWVGLGLLALIWLSTFKLQVPRHDELSREPAPAVVRALVSSNWIRTAAWSLRGVVALAVLPSALGSP
jgi:hypothetical protein